MYSPPFNNSQSLSFITAAEVNFVFDLCEIKLTVYQRERVRTLVCKNVWRYVGGRGSENEV